MRILLVNQFFWPDCGATSQLLTDLARYLKVRGHVVEVVCGSGAYSQRDETNPPGADWDGAFRPVLK